MDDAGGGGSRHQPHTYRVDGHERRQPQPGNSCEVDPDGGPGLGRLAPEDQLHNQIWKPALGQAGLEPTRENGMHALRHHYASMLLDGGVSIRALAEYLGHSDPGFTLRIYAHLMPDSEDRARAVVDAAFRAPAESPRNTGTATP